MYVCINKHTLVMGVRHMAFPITHATLGTAFTMVSLEGIAIPPLHLCMYVCSCMYVCIFMYDMFMNVCVYVCSCMYVVSLEGIAIPPYIYVCMYVHEYMYVRVCMYVHVCMGFPSKASPYRPYIYVCMYVHEHLYVCMICTICS